MESEKKTCEERIDAELHGRLDWLMKNPEEARENLLSIEKLTTFKLCLSFGGPADYFELDWSPEASAWVTGRYIFQDWFDGATRTISAETTEQVAEAYGIYPEE